MGYINQTGGSRTEWTWLCHRQVFEWIGIIHHCTGKSEISLSAVCHLVPISPTVYVKANIWMMRLMLPILGSFRDCKDTLVFGSRPLTIEPGPDREHDQAANERPRQCILIDAVNRLSQLAELNPCMPTWKTVKILCTTDSAMVAIRLQ